MCLIFCEIKKTFILINSNNAKVANIQWLNFVENIIINFCRVNDFL